MPQLIPPPPVTEIEPVTDVLHGVPITDPYRWLEDQNSPRTRAWIEQQTCYTRSYLDNIVGRERIRKRVREFLAVETYDSLRKVGDRYFFRKRLPGQEQPCICMREGMRGADQLLIDPSDRGTGSHTAVRLQRVSPGGELLLYEVKEGGERSGMFEILDVAARTLLPDVLPRGYLRGFVFSADGKGFYYVHESLDSARPHYRAVYRHVLGTAFSEDEEIFCAGESERLRLHLAGDSTRLAFLACKFHEKTLATLWVKSLDSDRPPLCVAADAEFSLCPVFARGKLLVITDRDAPNLRIVELRLHPGPDIEWVELVPESDARIHECIVSGDCVLVSYVRGQSTYVSAFDLKDGKTWEWPVRTGGRTVHLVAGSADSEEAVIEAESFTRPPATLVCSPRSGRFELWAERRIPFTSNSCDHKRVWYASKDGTRIPMFLVGRRDVLKGGCHPAIMTSYGGYAVSMVPRFSVFVAFLVERGFLFALPNIRGGSEFGAGWHDAAMRRNRQTAYDDFLAAAEWLIASGRTNRDKLAIFGGSNSGLLVGAALTQRPDLFRAVVCVAPLLDMLRYHLFDHARAWCDEFGTAEHRDDFAALVRYSPYHRVRDQDRYPATLLVSGDRDQTCNAMHARKMAARLQAANSSQNPIVLDYSRFRGHAPVLPLSDRIGALTDRMAFLCDQLQVAV